MLYLEQFHFLDAEEEWDFIIRQKRTCYDSFYPFQILTKHRLKVLDFEPITILYGGNGSGKTTALNVIAEKLCLKRDTLFNRTNFFEDYTNHCSYTLAKEVTSDSRIITSDDVFDFMLNIRILNDGITQKREDLFEDYLDAKYSNFQIQSIDDYEKLKKVNLTKSKTQSKFVRENLMGNVREHSNGESGFLYFMEKIKENGLYLLDEPENSLSPSKQQELLKCIEDSVRFFGCQFIISTHSPFLLSLKGAKIYDMDEEPVDVKKWTKLPNVLAYYELFRKYQDDFE